ncbi:MAG TPA: substrate-binding domain-containing protein [Acidimicrobiales bacterium]
MQSKKTRRLVWLALPLSLAIFAAACGDDDNTSSGDGTSGGNAAEDISGSINITGSSTVEPISSLVGEDFSTEYPNVNVAVEGPGTGDGFATFCKGDNDITDASRTIKDEEKAICEQNGVEYIELQIGYDGLTVMTNANNSDAPECLSFADLYALIGPESNGFAKWSDAQALATQLGSSTQFPDAELALTGPGTESGTYDSFIEIALKDIATERDQADDATRPDYDASSDDNVIVENIEASDSSLGWVGFAFAQEAGDEIKEIPISKEPGGDCVAPDADTIQSGDYPLSRSLYIYVNKAKAEENAAVPAFVDYYLADLKSFVEESDYVALPDADIDATKATWEGR